MDRVWVAIEGAVQAGLRDKDVLAAPPRTEEDWMWLSATITDHVCAGLPRDLYEAYAAKLKETGQPASSEFDIKHG
jgi:hypothetical protein